MLSCAAAHAYVLSLLELRVSPGADGDVPNVHAGTVEGSFCVTAPYIRFDPFAFQKKNLEVPFGA